MKKLLYTLLFLTGFAGISLAEYHPLDSVGLKQIDGKYYVQHKVEKGEGLFGIARRYQSSVDAIRKANPELGDNLLVGQIVLVPISYSPATQTEEESIIHIVKSGETLYSISRQYNVSVDEIKRKNNLSSNNLDIGQELVIKGSKKTQHTENYGGEERPVKPQPEENPGQNTATPGASGYEYNAATGEVKESGYAIVAVSESMNQERSFCLHPTAPSGTIIMVTHAGSNKSVFVRVVGKPGITENGVVIYLSQAAGKRLGIDENDRASVRLNYAK